MRRINPTYQLGLKALISLDDANYPNDRNADLNHYVDT